MEFSQKSYTGMLYINSMCQPATYCDSVAVNDCLDAINLFSVVQDIYIFFSSLQRGGM